MPLYRVTWEIDLEADSHHQAARKALDIQRRSASTATSFDVQERDGGLSVGTAVHVDLCPGLPDFDHTDSDGSPCRLVNFYKCPSCGAAWTDQWSCACNDRCPECGVEVEPEESEELVP